MSNLFEELFKALQKSPAAEDPDRLEKFERLITLKCSGGPIDGINLIEFAKAAARQKVRLAFSYLHDADPSTEDDIVNQALLILYNRIATLDSWDATPRYLYAVIKNLAQKLASERYKTNALFVGGDNTFERIPDPLSLPPENLSNEWARDFREFLLPIQRQIIASLSPALQEIAEGYAKDENTEEAAKRLNISKGAVRVRQLRLRNTLRRRFLEELERLAASSEYCEKPVSDLARKYLKRLFDVTP